MLDRLAGFQALLGRTRAWEKDWDKYWSNQNAHSIRSSPILSQSWSGPILIISLNPWVSSSNNSLNVTYKPCCFRFASQLRVFVFFRDILSSSRISSIANIARIFLLAWSAAIFFYATAQTTPLPGQIQKCPNDFQIFPNDIQIFQVNFRRFQMRFRNLHVNFR